MRNGSISWLLVFSLTWLGAIRCEAADGPIVTRARLSDAISSARLPHEEFTLANGLRVVVSPDRKAPVVAVSVWYHVGSKNEPGGQTGLAHLFEHLMFTGSENLPDGALATLERIGATDHNGITTYDWTNYFETVPASSLASALFLESDRMGHFASTLTMTKLDQQRSVVKNEGRENDGAPYGLARAAIQQGLFPPSHPYGHTVMGSFADLDQVTPSDAQRWFARYYTPANAVLVLAGDIDAATARRMVERYFGDIPSSPPPSSALTPLPPTPQAITIHDRVSLTRLYQAWTLPRPTDRDAAALKIAARLLGGMASARLDNILVHEEGVAVRDTASIQWLEGGGIFQIRIDVAPGRDPEGVRAKTQAILSDFLSRRPTSDELERAIMTELTEHLSAAETVGGRANQLGSGMIFAGKADYADAQLQAMSRLKGDEVLSAARRWLSKPFLSLSVLPGEREVPQSAPAVAKPAPDHIPNVVAGLPRQKPPIPTPGAVQYPTIEHARLASGLRVVYSRRPDMPETHLALTFDAGFTADPPHGRGTEALALRLLTTRTAGHTGEDLAAMRERIGWHLETAASFDRASILANGPSISLVPALGLLDDLLVAPSFADLEKARAAQIAAIKDENADIGALAWRKLPALLHGEASAYGSPASGEGETVAVSRLQESDLRRFRDHWFRPGNATLFVVSDRPLRELLPLLTRSFSDWKDAGASGEGKAGAGIVPTPPDKTVLFDAPNATQSLILGARTLSRDVASSPAIDIANANLAGDFTSRLNTDLRQSRGWSYGVNSGIEQYADHGLFWIAAPVESDRTAASYQAIKGDIRALITNAPITQAELQRAVENRSQSLLGKIEGAADLLDMMEQDDLLKRGDGFYAGLSGRLRALSLGDVNLAAARLLAGHPMTWIIVGDARRVAPQLIAASIPFTQGAQ